MSLPAVPSGPQGTPLWFQGESLRGQAASTQGSHFPSLVPAHSLDNLIFLKLLFCFVLMTTTLSGRN